VIKYCNPDQNDASKMLTNDWRYYLVENDEKEASMDCIIFNSYSSIYDNETLEE
jgi:hypothetical protein